MTDIQAVCILRLWLRILFGCHSPADPFSRCVCNSNRMKAKTFPIFQHYPYLSLKNMFSFQFEKIMKMKHPARVKTEKTVFIYRKEMA